MKKTAEAMGPWQRPWLAWQHALAPGGCQGQRRQGEASSQGVQQDNSAQKERYELNESQAAFVIVSATGTS